MEIRSSIPSMPVRQDSAAGADAPITERRAAGEVPAGTVASRQADGPQAHQVERQNDGVMNRHGKPAIAPPRREFSAAEMIDLLRNLQSKTQESQIRSAKEEIERNRIEQQQTNDRQLAKIDEWIEKSKAAEKSGILGKIFGWLGTIAAVLAAAVLTVAAVATTAVTAGAAGPVMCVMAGIAITSATLMLANQISSECGGPEISISNAIMQAVKALLVGFGVDSELAERIGNTVAGASMLLTGAIVVEPSVLGKMGSAIALMSGADEQVAGQIGMGLGLAATIVIGVAMAVVTFGAGAAGAVGNAAGNISAQSAKTIANLARDASTIASAAASITQGVGGIATGAETIDKAKAQKEADEVLAAKKLLEALMIKLQAAMDEEREKLKEVMQAIDESMRVVSQMINAASENMSQITSNIGKRAMV